jgi:hypothetical protein
MAKQATVTARLDALFNKVGPDALCVSFARDLAAAHGLNATSAEIRFYRWLDATRKAQRAAKRAARKVH